MSIQVRLASAFSIALTLTLAALGTTGAKALPQDPQMRVIDAPGASPVVSQSADATPATPIVVQPQDDAANTPEAEPATPTVTSLADLVDQSQSATGALQAMQATNQLLALQAKQSIQTQQLQLTQGRAASLELARQAAAVERGREVTRRFLGGGTAYSPQSVNFYGN